VKTACMIAFVSFMAICGVRGATPEMRAKFERLRLEWSAHCNDPIVRLNSRIDAYLDSPAYKQILEMGPAVVPLIMEKLGTDGLPWGFALEDLTHAGIMPADRHYDSEVTRQWKEWWKAHRRNWNAAKRTRSNS
jgi:hypothetical protein